jgi:hypothetical protein
MRKKRAAENSDSSPSHKHLLVAVWRPHSITGEGSRTPSRQSHIPQRREHHFKRPHTHNEPASSKGSADAVIVTLITTVQQIAIGLQTTGREDDWFEVIILPVYGLVREEWGPRAFFVHSAHFVLYCMSDLSSHLKEGRKNACISLYDEELKGTGRQE